jgi:predicted secreted protein
MAFLHGKSASFQIANSADALTNISAYCDTISLKRSFDTAETTTFGSTGSAKTYIMGLTDATISVSGKFDGASSSTVDGVLAGILGLSTSKAFEYKASSAATSATNPAYTGSCFLTSYEVSAPVGDVVTFSAEFHVTGAVTRATS